MVKSKKNTKSLHPTPQSQFENFSRDTVSLRLLKPFSFFLILGQKVSYVIVHTFCSRINTGHWKVVSTMTK